MELSRIAVFGLTIIGLAGVVLAGYVAHRLTQRQHSSTQPPDRREFDWNESSQSLSYGDSEIERKRRAERLQDKQKRSSA